MIVGLGVDLVSVERIAQALSRFGEHFLARCFLPGELSRPTDPQHVAGAFAAKEAALKALGTGWGQGVGFHHVLLQKDPQGKPLLCFLGPAQTQAQALGAQRAHLSITHTREMAAAVVVLSR
jgi:holo-[acyl-carrier protein] synthase